MKTRLRAPRPGEIAAAILFVIMALSAGFLAREENRHPGYMADLTYNPGFAVREYFARLSFNSAQWQNPKSVPDVKLNSRRLTTRIRMVDDLLSRHRFKGWSRQKVEGLLGPRTVTEYFADWELVYYLGPGRYGNAIGDSEWLVLRLDGSGNVCDHALVHD